MPRRKARLPVRRCPRCKLPGTFTGPNRWTKVCDRCRLDDASGVRHASDRGVQLARARNRALSKLQRRHYEEYRKLYEAEVELIDRFGDGATERERSEYAARLEAAIEAGWRRGQLVDPDIVK